MEAIKRLQRGANIGKFNMSKPKTYIEQVEYDKRSIPGPASYQVDPANRSLKGGRFNMSKSKTEVEWICYRAAQIPAPGQYNVEESVPIGGKFNLVSTGLLLRIFKNPSPPFCYRLESARAERILARTDCGRVGKALTRPC